MWFRQVVILPLCFAAVLMSGCLLISAVWMIDEQPPLTEKEKEVIEALKVHLVEDRWKRNVDWDILQNSKNPNAHFLTQNRWKYGNKITQGFLKRIDEEWQKRNDVAGYSHKKGQPLGKSLPTSASHWFLRELTDENTLYGWNAIILLGLQDDHHFSEELKILNRKTLERLVTRQLYYDAETGNLATPEKKTKSSSKNRSKSKNEKPPLPDEKIELTAGSSLEEFLHHAKQIEKQSAEKETQPKKTNRMFSFFRKKVEPQPRRNIKPVSRFMRLAAAEAWCKVLAKTDSDKIIALSPVGTVLKNSPLPNSIRAELMLGLAPWIPPNRIPRLPETFSLSSVRNKPKSSLLLRRAAIEACVIHAQKIIAEEKETNTKSQDKIIDYNPSIWPKRIINAQFDPDPHVRKLFVLWLVLSHHPQAFEITKSKLADVEPQVRLAALEYLGILHTPKAFQLLNTRSHRKEVPIRKNAMKGLSYWGTQNLGRFSQDESAEVREALATTLKNRLTHSSTAILQKLLSDRSQKVQLAAIEAIRDWPKDWAIPLLLQGMTEGTPRTSQASVLLLQEKTGLNFSFPVSAHLIIRREAVQKLSDKYHLRSAFPNEHTKPVLLQTSYSEEEKQRLKDYVFQIMNSPPESAEYFAASESLHALDSSSVPVLENVLEELHAGDHKFFTQELLPELSELYRAVNDLESNEPSDKLRGIRVLEKYGMSASLSPLIVRRILAVLKKGSDRTIWRSAMNAVMGDYSPLHAEVANYAARYFAPEIRILACRYFQRHRRAEFASQLLELLEDQDYNVKSAAIKAAGYCPNPIIVNGTPRPTNLSQKNSRGLTKVLMQSDRKLRTSAALSLARLGNPTGFQELIRESYQRDRKFREDAFRKMGQSGRRRFVEHLVQSCWIEKHPATRIVILDSLNRLVSEEERPSGLVSAKMYEEKAKLWSNWLENRQRN